MLVLLVEGVPKGRGDEGLEGPIDGVLRNPEKVLPKSRLQIAHKDSIRGFEIEFDTHIVVEKEPKHDFGPQEGPKLLDPSEHRERPVTAHAEIHDLSEAPAYRV